jgi:hypothetical protein
MKTKRIISRFFIVLIALFSLYLHSCEKEEWCAQCKAYICVFGGTFETRLICADGRRQCEEEIKDWVKKWGWECWECDEPSPFP